MLDRSGATRVSAAALLLAALAARPTLAQTAPPRAPGPTTVSEVVVTASRRDLVGTASTASQGSVTRQELELRPVFRPGQLYETVPGLVVTVHSGEGKANQYLLRGFNLDHGTDFASFVDGVPVNRPTNTHGQGYSDQNFLMPELIEGLDYTKGPYYAAIGDFGAVGSAHLRLLDVIPNQLSLSAGTLGDQNLFIGGTHEFDKDDRLIVAVDDGHLDGPWTHPDNFHRLNAALRFSHGDADDGFSVTAMYYHGAGNLTTDQPLRAVQQGLIDRFGTLDPTDGSRSERLGLSADYAARGDGWRLVANAYAVHSRMTLWNDFTHVLEDPIAGDQEEQTETRETWGGSVAWTGDLALGSVRTSTTFGLQARADDNYIDRRHTRRRTPLDYCQEAQAPAPDGSFVPAVPYATTNGVCTADRVRLLDLGPYLENTTHWTSWLRTVLGFREEYYHAADRSLAAGYVDPAVGVFDHRAFSASGSQTLSQPKASLVFGPWWRTEFYVSAGRGFHSDDVRGVFGTVPLEGYPQSAGRTPLLAAATGEEVGVRTSVVSRLNVEVAVFREDFNSELRYDQDQGQDSASAPSRRQGVEVSAQYKPFRWIELNTDLAFSKARYTGDLAAFGLSGPFIANAPTFIGSFGVLVNDLGPWFGGLQWRDLGPYPVTDGAAEPRDKGYSEVNLDVGRRLGRNLRVQLNVFNLFDSHADASAYDYTSRLPGEPPGGDAGLQVHPLEPISARFTLTATF